MLEFEKLEQECISKYSPNNNMGSKKEAIKNKKKKKLFDSESEEDNYGEQ